MSGAHARIEESSDAFRAAFEIHEARENLTTVRLFFLTDGVVRSLDLEPDEFPDFAVEHVIWDLEKLSRLRAGEHEAIEIDFMNHYGGPIPCLPVQDATGEYRTFLAFLPAPLLAKIYGAYGQRLLERNVRAFLQAKGKINRGLQRTLKLEPHRFLAYNNGLCCTAADVTVERSNEGHRLIRVRDLQIVNGGQTTASIYHALKKEKMSVDQVIVQLKLTVLSDSSKTSELVPLISRYANSQNKINMADFAANGPFQQHLEYFSRTVWAPATTGLDRGTRWFYERSRGSYADAKARQATPSQRRKWEAEHPPQQKFTKTDFAKFEHAWLGLPHLVCLGAEKNFARFAERLEEDGEPVVDQSFFTHAVAKAILFRRTEKLFDAQGLSGFRANSVAYAVAWLSERSGRRLDLDRIWREQNLTPATIDALKSLCAAAHSYISAQLGNQNEASKREFCWIEFRDREVQTNVQWLEELAARPFVCAINEEELLAQTWERVRHAFMQDRRSLGELEELTGMTWIASRRRDPLSEYAKKTWKDLRATRGLGVKKIRTLVQICSAASPGVTNG